DGSPVRVTRIIGLTLSFADSGVPGPSSPSLNAGPISLKEIRASIFTGFCSCISLGGLKTISLSRSFWTSFAIMASSSKGLGLPIGVGDAFGEAVGLGTAEGDGTGDGLGEGPDSNCIFTVDWLPGVIAMLGSSITLNPG